MKPTGKGMIHHIGGCDDCGQRWEARNVVGIASQHAARTGHRCWAETGHAYRWEPT